MVESGEGVCDEFSGKSRKTRPDQVAAARVLAAKGRGDAPMGRVVIGKEVAVGKKEFEKG